MAIIRNTFYLTLFLWGAFCSAIDYSDMEAIFRASKTPEAEKMLGFWVGRCIHQADPLREWPAFFKFGKIEKTSVGFGQYSQSHTWFNEQTDKYDSYTNQQLLKDPQCKKWLDSEQWHPVFYQNGSLVNEYQYPNSKVSRATRLYFDGIREHIIVAYGLGNDPGEFPASFCYFNVRLESLR